VNEWLSYVVIGIATGAVYSIAAMGLVVTYTTSGVFNFAHGAVGMVAAYVTYSLREDLGLPTPLAIAVVLLVVTPVVGAFLDRVLLGRFSGGRPSSNIVLSLGLLVALQGSMSALYGAGTRRFEPIFPTSTVRIGGVNVGKDQLCVLLVAVLAAVALYLLFTRTQIGLATQAVVGDRDLTRLVGVDAAAVTTFSWVLGCTFAGLAGILFAPLVGLDSLLLTLLVVQAFGAAVVGRLRSLPLANLGAYGIAIAASVSTKFVADHPTLRGVPSALPFIVLFGALVLGRRGRFTEVDDERRDVGDATRPLPARLLVCLGVVGVVVPLVVDGPDLLTASVAVAYVLVFVSLGLVVGLSRQVSLCHAAFVALGATTLSHLLDAGIPWPFALAAAGLFVVPIGAAIAIPAIRLSGLFLALATFGFGVLAESLLFGTSLVFGDDGNASVARPAGLESDTRFYYAILAVVVAGVVAVEKIRVTRLGRILRAMADSPVALQASRINPTASKVMVFCISAFLAAVAGGLLGSLIRTVNLVSFNSFQSLTWLTILVTAGAASLGGSVLAAVLLVVAPAVFTSSTFAEWQPVAFGIGAIVLSQRPNGIAGLVRIPPIDELAARAAARGGASRHATRMAEAAR
jgi:branched-subunit amino acid ABC-type transport system permease component